GEMAPTIPQPYAVYVDETDAVWVSDWGSNAILRFDPKTENLVSFPLPDHYAGVRQLAGRKGEVLGCRIRSRSALRAESGVEGISLSRPNSAFPTHGMAIGADNRRRKVFSAGIPGEGNRAAIINRILSTLL